MSLCCCFGLGDTEGMALQSQGNVMCLLRPRGQVRKGELKHEYGILVHNMEEDSFLGTCFMQDGRYVTLSWQEINKAFKKVKEDAYVISSKNEELLRDLYDAVMMDVLTLEKNIEFSECAYHQQKEAAREARDARREQQHITIAGTPPDDAVKASNKINLNTVQEVEGPAKVVNVDPVSGVEGGERSGVPANASVDPLRVDPESKVNDDQHQESVMDKNLPSERDDAGGDRSGVPAKASVDPLHRPSLETVDVLTKIPAQDSFSGNSGCPHDFPPPPMKLPNGALHESESEVRTRLAAFLKSMPGEIVPKEPSSMHAPLKRKREDKESSVDDPSDFKDEVSSEDDQGDFKKTCADSSVPIKVKRDRLVRRQDRSNRSEKNWTTAMKRHWNTKQKDIAMALITIKRDQIQEVKLHLCCILLFLKLIPLHLPKGISETVP